MAEIIKVVFERKFYATNNSTRTNLNDNDFLLTTAVNQQYRFDFLPANLQEKVVRLMKSEVKSYSCRETVQSGQVPLVSPNKPKAQLP